MRQVPWVDHVDRPVLLDGLLDRAARVLHNGSTHERLVVEVGVGGHHGPEHAIAAALGLEVALHDDDAMEQEVPAQVEVPFHQENPLPHAPRLDS